MDRTLWTEARLPPSFIRRPAHVITGSTLSGRLEAEAMKARDVMTSAIISATGDTSVRDIAQLLLQNHISAIPILDNSGAPVGMVSEGDLIGRDETQRNARHEGWLALLAEGESLSPDFLSAYVAPSASQSTSCRGRSSPSARTWIPARSRVCSPPIGSSACPWCETDRWLESSAARICSARLQVKSPATTLSLARELWRVLWRTCWRRLSGVSSARTTRQNRMHR